MSRFLPALLIVPGGAEGPAVIQTRCLAASGADDAGPFTVLATAAYR